VLELHEAQELTPLGWTALAIYGANCYGLDKLPTAERLRWFNANQDNIEAVATDPKACRWWTHAKDPWRFLNFCLNQKDCRTVAWADATSNGFQFIAALTGDEKLARLTNLIPDNHRHDLYSYVTDLVIPEALAQLGTHPSLKHCFDRGIDRDLLKPVIMAIPYGVSVVGMSRLLSEDILKWIRTQPVSTDPLSRYIDGAARLTTIIHNVMKREFPKLYQLMALLQKAARIRLKTGKGVEWTTPTGWPWRQAIPELQTTVIRPNLSPEVTLWTEVQEEREGTLDLERNVSATPANFIHSLDAAVLQLAINKLPEGVPVASVHDCIGTHPNYMAQFQQAYRESFRDVVSMPLIQSFLDRNLSVEEQLDLEELKQACSPLPKKTIDQTTLSTYLLS
jgi:DNA-directed RNA polymerase